MPKLPSKSLKSERISSSHSADSHASFSATTYHGIFNTCSRPAKPRNGMERALLKLPEPLRPHPSAFPTDEEIDAESLVSGVKPQDLAQARKDYHTGLDELFPGGREFNVASFLGAKPLKGDAVDIISIPDSSYSIRLWDGGLGPQGQCCFDFIDSCSGQPVISPDGWKIGLGDGYSKPLISWEQAWGIKKEHIPPAEERFSAILGTWYVLERPSKEVFWFEVPRPRPPAGVHVHRPTRSTAK